MSIHPTTNDLYAAVGPGITQDDDGTLLKWLDGPGGLLGAVDDIVRDQGSSVGWSREFDPGLAQSPKWTGQFLGVVIPDGFTDAQARQQIIDRPSFRRGTVGALVGAAQALLTGTKYVAVKERDTSAYHLTVTTYTTETASTSAVNAALQAAKPAGLVLVLSVVPPTSYAASESMAALTYSAFEAQTAQTYTAYETGA